MKGDEAAYASSPLHVGYFMFSRFKFRKRLCFALISISLYAGTHLLFPLIVHADGGAPNLAYVSGTAGSISVIDVVQQKVTRQIAIQGNPQTLVLSVDGRTLAVTQPDLGQVTILAAKTSQTLCTAHVDGHPSLLTFDPGTNTLFAAATDTSSIYALNPLTCATQHVFETSSRITGIAVAIVGAGIGGGTGNQLWVATRDSLVLFNMSGSPIARLSVAGSPQYLCIPSGPTAYVTTRAGTLVAIDVNSRKSTQPLLTGGVFGLMDYDATTGEVYVPDQQHQRLDVLSSVRVNELPLRHQPERILRFRAAPQSVAITSDGQLGFVALENGEVVMLDVQGRQTIKPIAVGGHPHFVITGLYPSLISFTPQQSLLYSLIDTLVHYGAAVLVALVAVVLIVYDRLRVRRAKTKL